MLDIVSSILDALSSGALVMVSQWIGNHWGMLPHPEAITDPLTHQLRMLAPATRQPTVPPVSFG